MEISVFNDKKKRDNVYSDIEKMLSDLSSKNKDISQVNNTGFILGGKCTRGKRYIQIDNVAGTGEVYTKESITNDSKLKYELSLRSSNLFTKFSSLSSIISEVSTYFNIDNLTYLDLATPGYFRKRKKEAPSENTTINFIFIKVKINKEIEVAFHNTNSDIRDSRLEDEFSNELKKLGITEDELGRLAYLTKYTNEEKNLIEKIRKSEIGRISKEMIPVCHMS